ncbi:MAG: hypothetical protein JWP20_236, partial [Roseomonas sp.]|nr:hypothetical protein [Roseomonas sp.]
MRWAPRPAGLLLAALLVGLAPATAPAQQPDQRGLRDAERRARDANATAEAA